MFVWPHGIDVDDDGNVWIADARGNEDLMRGNQVIKFSPQGEVLLRLGTAGVGGRTRTTLNEPNDVLVAPNGDIFVADGHDGARGNNRIVKYSSDGRYLMEWGEGGSNPGEFRTPPAPCCRSPARRCHPVGRPEFAGCCGLPRRGGHRHPSRGRGAS